MPKHLGLFVGRVKPTNAQLPYFYEQEVPKLVTVNA